MSTEPTSVSGFEVVATLPPGEKALGLTMVGDTFFVAANSGVFVLHADGTLRRLDQPVIIPTSP